MKRLVPLCFVGFMVVLAGMAGPAWAQTSEPTTTVAPTTIPPTSSTTTCPMVGCVGLLDPPVTATTVAPTTIPPRTSTTPCPAVGSAATKPGCVGLPNPPQTTTAPPPVKKVYSSKAPPRPNTEPTTAQVTTHLPPTTTLAPARAQLAIQPAAHWTGSATLLVVGIGLCVAGIVVVIRRLLRSLH